MHHNPHKPACLESASTHVVSLNDIGNFPSSLVATQISEDSKDFSSLRLCCKGAYGAQVSSLSSTPHISTSQTGMSRQTTRLHLASRVFLAPEAVAGSPASACRATALLSQHPGVTDLSISQPRNIHNPRNLIFQPLPESLPHLLKLSVFLRNNDFLQNGISDVIHMEIDATCFARLRCLAHLNLQLCSLGPGFSEVLAQLPHLTELKMKDIKGVSELSISALPALQIISMQSTDIAILTIENSGLLISLDASASDSLVSCRLSGCLSLTTLTLTACAALPRLDVGSCAALERLDVTDCDLLTELVASGCSNLIELNACPCDEMAELNIKGCSKLEVLNTTWLLPEQLDPSVQGTLRVLSVFNSTLSSLPTLPMLQELDLYSCTALSTLDLNSHGLLRILSLHSCNSLASLCLPLGLEQLILNNCSDLLELDASQLNQLQLLTVESCNSLQSLDVSHLVCLTSLRVKECYSMAAVSVSNCLVLGSVDVVSSRLAKLSIAHVPLLVELRLSTSPRVVIEVTALQVRLSDCPTLLTITAKHTGMAVLDVSCLSALKTLDASGCSSLLDVNAAGCASLETLILAGCSSMQRLDLQGTTQLRTIRLTGCSTLVEMNSQLLDGCSVHDMRLSFNVAMLSPSAYTYLTQLYVEGCNDIAILNLSSCPNLRSLIVTSCLQLQRLDVTCLKRLRLLTVEDCESLTDIGGTWPEHIARSPRARPIVGGILPKESVSWIEQLNITNCPLQRLDLAFFPSIKELHVQNCQQLLMLETQDCQGLKTLKMHSCKAITKLDLSCTVSLGKLVLWGLCSLLRVDLHGCTGLQTVDLDDSALVDLDVRDSYLLSSLRVADMPCLERVTAANLPSLQSLWVSEAPKLQALQLSGSTTRLEDFWVGPESPLPTMDLKQAPRLRKKFLLTDSSVLCAVCSVGSITHAFLHMYRGVAHCVCTGCAQKVDGKRQVQIVPACLVCSAPCQLSQIF